VADDFDTSGRKLTTNKGIDTEELTGRTFPYQFDRTLVEDIHLMQEGGMNAVFDRYTNAFLKIHFDIPEGREDEFARKVLIKHLQEGNSYGIWLKHKHAKFAQPELGSWLAASTTVGENWQRPELEGWLPPVH